MNLVELPLPDGHPMRPGRLMRGGRPASVTVHWTGNTDPGADALMHASYMAQAARKRRSSWHYTVDAQRVVRHLPETEQAWHAGKRKGNETSIGVEVCVDPSSATPGGPIKLETMQNLVELLADICRRYRWPPDAEHIREHRSWTGKNCPDRRYIDLELIRPVVAVALQEVPILLGGQVIARGRLQNGQTMVFVDGRWVHIRAVADALGLGVSWNEERRAVVLTLPQVLHV